jgi:hypothetical protein
MGSGRWSTDIHDADAVYRARTGRPAFGYTADLRTRRRGTWRAHPTLDPLGVAARESRDSDEHPATVSIAVLFDVTGSMGRVPQVLQQKLPDLFGLLLRKGYVEHPQILFGGIGDATCDRVPLQIGQFESDNRLEQNLLDLFLEGGGGGQMTESYELAMYFMARHTSTDCFERRGHRGYLFIIGDELPYGHVKPHEVRHVIGDDLTEPIAVDAIVDELTQKFDTYYILPEGAAYAGRSEVLEPWRELLGQNVLQLDDLDATCETIALTIGLAEGTIDLDTGLDHLRETGSTAVATVSKALVPLGNAVALRPGMAIGRPPAGLERTDIGGMERL